VSCLYYIICTYLCRCVSDEQRTLALGLQSMLVHALGNVPGPIIIGALFDSSCLYRQEECGNRGNCWVYDNKLLSLRIFLVCSVIMTVSLASAFCAWLFFRVILCNRYKVNQDNY